MAVVLQSEDLQFDLTLPDGRWGVRAQRADFPILEGANFGAEWRVGRAGRTWSGRMPEARVSQAAIDAAPLSPNHCLRLDPQPVHGIAISLEMCLGLDAPLLCWRVTIENRTPDSIRLDHIDMLRLGPPSGQGHARLPARLRLGADDPDLAFFSNGWGSWNITGALGRSDRFPRTRLGPLTLPMSQGAVGRQSRARGVFTSEMFGVVGDRVSRLGLLLGFLSQRAAFGGLRVNVAGPSPSICVWEECDGVIIDPAGTFTTDWCCLGFIHLDEEDPMGIYLDQVAGANRARTHAPTPVGWCSWYQFFQAVTEDDVRANIAWGEAHRSRLPLEVIQLDDGFAAEVGDWYVTSAGFASGLPPLSRSIREAGFMPGVWLAPFVAKPRARIVRDHPDWILRNRIGIPANVGFTWDTFTRALDVTHPQVIEHVEDLITTAVYDWGFDYLKLDFLYAGALRGVRHDARRTRAQALRSILERIRSAAGEERFLVGCGCPLGSGIGVFDAMRIGADAATTWEPEYRNLGWVLRSEPGMPSVRNAIHNVITRAPLNRRWWLNDPDCLIWRSGVPTMSGPSKHGDPSGRRRGQRASSSPAAIRPSHLSWDETKTLGSVIALSGGSFLVSDHLPDLSTERLDWLARLLPPMPEGLRAIDWFDERHPKCLVVPVRGAAGEWFVIVLINWASEPADLSFDLKALKPAGPFVHAVDFWGQTYMSVKSDDLHSKGIGPHGVQVLSIRMAGGPQWLGDTLHISQGLAVSRMRPGRHALDIDLNLGRWAAGRAWLELPSPPRQATLDGRPVDMRHVEGDVYVCELSFEGNASLRVNW